MTFFSTSEKYLLIVPTQDPILFKTTGKSFGPITIIDTVPTREAITQEITTSTTDADGNITTTTETYEKNVSRTKITIKVNLILHGSLKIIGFFAKKRIQIHMEKVMDEFVNYSKNNSA